MSTTHVTSHHPPIDPLAAALHSALVLEQQGAYGPGGANAQTQPFITISRETGAGGQTFGRALLDRLNAKISCGPKWTLWDDDLIQKVAREHALGEAFVQALEDQPHGWFHDFLDGLPFASSDRHPDEFRVYRRVASTIRALGRAGRAIIVGRGGAFITADLAGGVHVRLIAPFEFRVQQMVRRLEINSQLAADRVREIDHNRSAFYRKYWPAQSMQAESFAITLNSARIEIDRMVDCVLPLVTPHAKCKGAGNCGSNRNANKIAAAKTAAQI